MNLTNQNMYCERTLLYALSNNNDQIAFETLFNHYKNKIYGIAHKFTHCTITSEEIVQEVFMIVWLKRADFSKVENFGAYIITITKNLVYKLLREKARQFMAGTPFEADDSFCNTDMPLLTKEYEDTIRKAIEKLPTQQQKVYILVKEVGLKRSEAAEMLHVTPHTIKFHLAQALKNIRTYCTLYLNALIFCFFTSSVAFLNLFSYFYFFLTITYPSLSKSTLHSTEYYTPIACPNVAWNICLVFICAKTSAGRRKLS